MTIAHQTFKFRLPGVCMRGQVCVQHVVSACIVRLRVFAWRRVHVQTTNVGFGQNDIFHSQHMCCVAQPRREIVITGETQNKRTP